LELLDYNTICCAPARQGVVQNAGSQHTDFSRKQTMDESLIIIITIIMMIIGNLYSAS
jgi:hypothetical protein